MDNSDKGLVSAGQDTGVAADAAGLSPSVEPVPVSPPDGASIPNAHTPGPWAWFGNASSNSLYLATTHSGRRYVMGFKRWGFGGAQPQFQPEGRGLVDASKLLMFQVGDRDVRGVEQAKANSSVYRLDINGIDCADARLIAAAPELLEALQTARDYVADAHNGYALFDGRPLDKGMTGDDLARIDAAISKAQGEA